MAVSADEEGVLEREEGELLRARELRADRLALLERVIAPRARVAGVSRGGGGGGEGGRGGGGGAAGGAGGVSPSQWWRVRRGSSREEIESGDSVVREGEETGEWEEGVDTQEGPGIVAREVWDRSEHETGDSV